MPRFGEILQYSQGGLSQFGLSKSLTMLNKLSSIVNEMDDVIDSHNPN